MSSTETPAARRTGLLLAAVAAVMWSSSGLFAKAPFFDDWPLATRGIHLAFWRAVFASVVLSLLARRPSFSWAMLPMTICFVVMNYTFLTAMTLTTAANTIWLQHLAPVWIFLIGVFALGETVHRGDWSMMLMGLAGAGTILMFELRSSAAPLGVVLAVLSGVTYAGVVLSIRVLRHHDSAWLITLNHLVTVICFLPWVVLGDTTPTVKQLVCLGGFGVFQMGLPYLIFALCLKRISGHQASAIILLEPVLTPLWVFLAWGHLPTYEPPRWWTFAGAALILLGLSFRLFVIGEQERRVEDDHSDE